MMKSHAYQNKGVAVFGLGKSGLSTAQRLHDGCANVRVWDDRPAGREAAENAGLDVQNFQTADFSNIDILVLSPGVPLTHPAPHPVVELANRSNVDIVGDVEIFLNEKTAGKLVGITGTNGKSTTSALIHHMLADAGRDTALGGNIGTPVMDLPQLNADGTYVLELSSYQLDLTPSWKADIAVILNITPDHLDRHGGLGGYTAVKAKIFQNQNTADVAIINIDDAICKEIASKIEADNGAKLTPISVEMEIEAGVTAVGGILVDNTKLGAGWTFDINRIDALRGKHNWQNACAAVAVTRALGLSNAEIAKGLKTFGGLAHRMELVAKRNNVRFINDSKATNAEAAEKSLASFENIFWICGGVAKAGGIESLAPHFDNIRHAYLIGAASEEFAATLDGQVSYTECDTLEVAVLKAAKAAELVGQEATVLLAPAAASFDQFKSFEARGDVFRDLVEGLGK